MTITKRSARRPQAPTSWDSVAAWYDGWMGKHGSKHHRALALPAVLDLLDPQPHEAILDIGSGQGVLAPAITRARARYTGVDASPKLLRFARKHHGRHGVFLLGDARQLPAHPDLHPGAFDAAVFLLSIQDMDPLDAVLDSAAWALRPGGRLVLLMTHPCFRVPRQSGWGWDRGRRLQFRRVDRYLTTLAVPMAGHTGQGATRTFHRPLHEYVNGLARHGLLVDRLDEITGDAALLPHPPSSAEAAALDEIPLFLALRARKTMR